MKNLIKNLWSDESGEMGALEKLLIVAFIVVPLIVLLIFFREDLLGWATQQWDVVNDGITNANPSNATSKTVTTLQTN